MNRIRLRVLVPVTVALTLLAAAGWAIQPGTERALNAFRRYESDFTRWQRDLAALARKVDEQRLRRDSAGWRELQETAKDINERSRRRYDLLEDLFQDTQQLYPEDRAPLRDGWVRIEDGFMNCRDTFERHFGDGAPPAAPAAATHPARDTTPPADAAPVEQDPGLRDAPTPTPAGSSGAAPADSQAVAMPPVAPPPVAADAGSGEAPKRDRFFIGGTLRLDFRNRNEDYTAENTSLPNNLSQAQLNLQYQLNAKDKLLFQDRFLKRRRNEDVRENQAILSFIRQHSPKTTFNIKDTLHHVWYPENETKNYRDNLFELNLNRKEGKVDRLYNLGYRTRLYPNYSASDYRQWNIGSEHTYYVRDGIFFTDLAWNDRRYDNTSALDYQNLTWGVDFNRSYSGNKSEVAINNTYDWRAYDREAVNLFRANYWDDFFSFRYEVPTTARWTMIFEDEWQRRVYASDYGRGYGKVQLRTTANVRLDDRSRGQLQHTYAFHDENTRSRAHRNHEVYGMYDHKINDKVRFRIMDTFHRRDSEVGNLLDYDENEIGGRVNWQLSGRQELVWNVSYLNRGYDTDYFNSYRYLLNGLTLQYNKPKKVDWLIRGELQQLRFDRANAASPYALFDDTTTLNKVEGRYNFWIGDDKRVKFTAMRQKTYYKSFDNISQELLLDFTRPLTVTEFIGELEYNF